jgi:hypothetical protein
MRDRPELKIVEPFPSALTTGDMANILGLDVSDRITVTNDDQAFSTKVNGDYYIDSIDRQWGTGEIVCVYRLAPVDASMFIIGSSVLAGSDVLSP